MSPKNFKITRGQLHLQGVMVKSPSHFQTSLRGRLTSMVHTFIIGNVLLKSKKASSDLLDIMLNIRSFRV